MEDHTFSKVEILIQQQKYKDAEKYLADLLATDPNNTSFLYLLSEVHLQQGNLTNATLIIDQAIAIAPDESHLFFAKARIELSDGHKKEAEKLILHAINLDPYDADYFALLAKVKLQKKEFEEALSYSNEALEIDAENMLALNTRSTALTKLNRAEESFETIEGALREDPNNPYTHANYGWNLLEKGDHKKALNHFKEALQNNPNYEYAQSGMLEAIKATNPIYRLFLKYSFWIGNLTAKNQWGVLIGFYLIVRVLRVLANRNEALQPYLTPVITVLAIMAFSTWIITPISNLFLRFNKYGQFLLDKKEKLSSNFVAISLLCAVISVLLTWFIPNEKFYSVAIYFITLMIPFSKMFELVKNGKLLRVYTGLLVVIGAFGILKLFFQNEEFNGFILVYLIGFIGFQWVYNYLTIQENK